MQKPSVSPSKAFSTPSFSLAARFAFAASIVLCNGMALLGGWVISRVEHGVVQSAAQSSALYMESILRPAADALSTLGTLPADVERAIDGLRSGSALGKRVVAIKIWRPDGLLAYSTDKSLAGKTYPATPELRSALLGHIDAKEEASQFGTLANERFEVPVRRIYAPIHRPGNDHVVAAIEFYERTDGLESDLARTRRQNWLILGGFTVAMIALLFGIVHKGSRMLQEQQWSLEQRMAEETRLNFQNTMLRRQLEQASRRSVDVNERFLRRVGSDLHDGPAQSLALALLRIDELVPYLGADAAGQAGSSPRDTLETIRRATTQALTEIRNISAGLALPELQRISPADALAIAVRSHECATGTRVESHIEGLPARLPLTLTICLYRFAQEALNNAFRHAGGKGQELKAVCNGATIEVEIADAGPGFNVDDLSKRNDRLGLAGLRYRVESLGGTLNVQSVIGEGTRLSVQFRNPLVSENHG